MIEIEKPQIECTETPGDATYGKYVVEPLERGTVRRWAMHSAALCFLLCLAPLRPPLRSPVYSMSFPPFRV